MSGTIAGDIVGPSYWAFMATVMAECLDKFINDEEVTPSDIPEGIYDGAKEFFDLVLEAAGDKFPENPPASINAYVIATDALRGSLKPFPTTSQDLKIKLERYAKFVRRLAKPRPLTNHEAVETATSLREFFLSLAQDGEAEMYERSIQAEPLSTGYRLL